MLSQHFDVLSLLICFISDTSSNGALPVTELAYNL